MYEKIADEIIAKYGVAVRSSFEGEWHITIDVVELTNSTKINMLFVPETYRKQGIATEIIQLIEEQSEFVELEAFPYSDNKGNTKENIDTLVKWYQKLGYELEYQKDYDCWLEDADDRLYSYEELKAVIGMYKEM